MQAGGSRRRCGSRAVAVLVCLALNAACSASSLTPPLGTDTESPPGSPDNASGEANPPPQPGPVPVKPDGGVVSEPDAGLPDAGGEPEGCLHTTRRWQATLDGGVYSGRVEQQYGTDGKLLQEQVFNAADAMTSEHTYAYSPGGQLTDEENRATDPSRGTTSSIRTQRTYDAEGRLLTRTTMAKRQDPNHSPWIWLTTVRHTYDSAGRRLQREERVNNPDGSHSQFLQAYSYDAHGRLDKVESFYGGELRVSKVATYDAQGRLERVDEITDYGRGLDNYTYPAEGGWEVLRRATDWRETWTYDAQGRVLEMTWGHSSGSGSESFRFDTAGRLLRHGKGESATRRSDSQVEAHTYDAEGRRVRTEIERRGYDSHTHPVDRYEESMLMTYTYDAAGQFRMREERVVRAINGFESQVWESAPPGFLLQRTEARGRTCRPPPDAPPPQDPAAFGS